MDELETKFVRCRPTDDPEVVETKHRSTCLLKPMEKCRSCPNSKFTLIFETPDKKLKQVQCPRWNSVGDLHSGKYPDTYAVTEEATCKEKPFPFCGSCPSRKELQELHIDKEKDGWYSRWVRFKKELLNADDATG